MTLSIVLAGLLLAAQGDKPIVPGDPGYVLKRAQEMVELSRCREADGRMDLLLAQSRERLREREAMGAGPFDPESARIARGLGESYRHLVLDGGSGTLECGVAEGRDMKAAQSRYLQAVSSDHERWQRLLSSLPADDRVREGAVLRVPEEAPGRSREAEAAGLDFLKKEQERRKAAAAPPAPRPESPQAPPGPALPPPSPAPRPLPPAPAPETSKPTLDPPKPVLDPSKPTPDPSKPDPDRPGKDDAGDSSHRLEHHSHPHRPHH